MPKRKNDPASWPLSKLYNNNKTTYFPRQYFAFQPHEESEAMRRGREAHRNIEWPSTPARDPSEDKTK